MGALAKRAVAVGTPQSGRGVLEFQLTTKAAAADILHDSLLLKIHSFDDTPRYDRPKPYRSVEHLMNLALRFAQAIHPVRPKQL